MQRLAATLLLVLVMSGGIFASSTASDIFQDNATELLEPGNGNNGGVHPSKVNAILQYCSDFWNVSISVLKKEYNQGNLTIDETLYGGTQLAYDVTSPSQGIVCVLDLDIN